MQGFNLCGNVIVISRRSYRSLVRLGWKYVRTLPAAGGQLPHRVLRYLQHAADGGYGGECTAASGVTRI